ncbi:ARM repeat-containing protein [Russula vinacea]|nr:ARM repeat-containing protein [Russula vinacea]
MSQQQSTTKPSLQGVRIRTRKGAVKAHAKHEPTVFRDQVYKHLETVPQGDYDAVANKLIQAGSTLEFLKYAEALFDILFVGGLLQPGGGYLDAEGPTSPFSLFQIKGSARSMTYQEKPLEDNSLPTLLQYVNKREPEQRDRFAATIGLILAQGLASAACLQSLTKDHLVKNDLSVNVLTIILRVYVAEASMDHLAAALKKGGIKDLITFFPPNRRTNAVLDAHFRGAGLPQVADWWTRKQNAVVAAVHAVVEERPLPEAELVASLWQGLMAQVDWSARPDQIEGLALREVSRFAPIIEPFCPGPKTEVALINAVQSYCYEDTRIMKAFPQILKVLYNKDCVSDQAIIYWHQKGSKPQGRQHFLKATEGLVKFLQEQDDSEEE